MVDLSVKPMNAILLRKAGTLYYFCVKTNTKHPKLVCFFWKMSIFVLLKPTGQIRDRPFKNFNQ